MFGKVLVWFHAKIENCEHKSCFGPINGKNLHSYENFEFHCDGYYYVLCYITCRLFSL